MSDLATTNAVNTIKHYNNLSAIIALRALQSESNTLAQLQQFEAAKAYQQALDQRANFQQAADNKTAEELLKQQQNQQQQSDSDQQNRDQQKSRSTKSRSTKSRSTTRRAKPTAKSRFPARTAR